MTVKPNPPYSSDLASCGFFLFRKLKLRIKGRRFDTHRTDSRGIAVGTWHYSKKGLPGMLPSRAEMMGLLYSCKRGVLWRWFNIQGKQTSFYKYCPGTFGYTLVLMHITINDAFITMSFNSNSTMLCINKYSASFHIIFRRREKEVNYFF